MGDIGKSSISRSSILTLKRQRSLDVGTNGGFTIDVRTSVKVSHDVFGDDEMESIPGFETSHQDLFEDEMQTRMEAL